MPLELKNKSLSAYYDALSPVMNRAYTDIEREQKLAALESNSDLSSIRYKKLMKDLDDLTQLTDSADISRKFISILKDMIFQVMQDYGIEIDMNLFEICIAGSIARSTPTMYSDLEYFPIFSRELSDNDKRNLLEVFSIIRMTQNTITNFARPHCFALDQGGVAPHNINGTVEEIFDFLDTADDPGFNFSVESAISITGENSMLNALQQQLHAQTITPSTCFSKVTANDSDFKGPQDLNSSIDIKKDILRPITFILQGFRIQSDSNPNEFLSQKNLIQHLKDKNLLSPPIATLINYISERALKIRLRSHADHKMEFDEIDSTDPNYQELKDLVFLVGWLRGALEKYLIEYQKYERHETDEIPKFTLNLNDYLSNNQRLATLAEADIAYIKELQRNTLELIARDQLDSKAENSILHTTPSKPDVHESTGEANEFVFAPLMIFRNEIEIYKSTNNYLFFPPSNEKLAILEKLEKIFQESEKKIIDSNFDPNVCLAELQKMIHALVELGLKNAEFQHSHSRGAGKLADILNRTLHGLIITLEQLESSKAYDIQSKKRAYSDYTEIVDDNNVEDKIKQILNNNSTQKGEIKVKSNIQYTEPLQNNQVRLNTHILKDPEANNQNNQKTTVKVCSAQRIYLDNNGRKTYRSEQYLPKIIVLTNKQLTEWAMKEVQNLLAVLDKEDKGNPISINAMPAREAAFIAACCEAIHHEYTFSKSTQKPDNNLFSQARESAKTFTKSVNFNNMFMQEIPSNTSSLKR